MTDIVTGKSLDIAEDRLQQLQQVLPEVFTEGKIDWERLRLALKDNVTVENERYVLNWAGKSEAYRVLQTGTGCTLAPAPAESVNFDTTQNVFIEGENLEVLKVLQKAYYGKVKMIYIDPPYNTGSDSFIYPDKFSESKEEYLKRVGDKDEEGYMLKEGLFRKNSKENGQFHSNWLNMMFPRLYLARNLMRDDGVIFVSIDDNEVHNLRLLMNEIFGEENFVASIIWQKKYSPQNDATYFSNMHDYLLCFAKRKKQVKTDVEGWTLNLLGRTEEQNARYQNPDNDPRGLWKSSDMSVKTYSENYDYEITTPTGRTITPPKGRSWVFGPDKFDTMVRDNRIWFGKDGNSVPSIKKFLTEVKQGIVPSTIWFREEVGDNQEASKEIRSLFEYPPFDTPKPTRLIKRILELTTSPESNDIIIDFFAGSATTAHAVMDQNKEDGGNRSFVMVQLPEKVDEKSEAFKAGYKTIADISADRIRRAIQKIEKEKEENNDLFTDRKNGLDLGFKVFKLKHSNFKLWRGDLEDEEEVVKQLSVFEDPMKPGAQDTNMLYELMLKAGYPLTSQIEEKKGFYSIAGGELVIALSKVEPSLAQQILKQKPRRCIILDRLFENNDQLKSNTRLQLEDAGVEFQTV